MSKREYSLGPIAPHQLQFEVERGNPDMFVMSFADRTVKLPIPEGYGPPQGGLLLTENLGDVAGKEVCDLGTGFYGLNAVASWLRGASQGYGIDVDPRAVAWASAIISRQNLSTIHITQGDSLDVFGGKKFDAIFGNLPMLPVTPGLNHDGDFFHYGGPTGWEMMNSYFGSISRSLNAMGYVRFLVLDFLGIDRRFNSDIPSIFERFDLMGLDSTIIDSEESVVRESHPFNTVVGLFDYAKKLYPLYDFSAGKYRKVVVDGRLT